MDKELLKGIIDIVILSLTSRKDMYGYAITKTIKDRTNSLYEIGEGTLYPALKRLEERNFLTSYWGESEKGGRRKYYMITDEGTIQLKRGLNNLKVINNLISECLEKGDDHE